MKGIITIKRSAIQIPKAIPLTLVASKPAKSFPSLARSFELYSASSEAFLIPVTLGLLEIYTINYSPLYQE